MKSLFRGKKILVIGDVILDQFVEGVITRKSPEANAPIVRREIDKNILGGAGNVAANIKTLGGMPELVSVVGNDGAAEVLESLLKKSKIINYILRDNNRPTTVKVRIFGNGKYLLRFDNEVEKKISKKLSKKLLVRILGKIKHFDAIALSDYNKGVFSKELTSLVIREARRLNIPVLADAKPENLAIFKGVTLLKPNKLEVEKMTQSKDMNSAVKSLSKKLGSSVLVTRGDEGMLLLVKGAQKATPIKALKVRAKDIVGAGDVVLATMSLALASKMPMEEAARLANKAAALSVEKHGTATVSIKEL